MKLSDLDKETRTILIMSRIVVRNPTKDNLRLLSEANDNFDETHADEMYDNLLQYLDTGKEDNA